MPRVSLEEVEERLISSGRTLSRPPSSPDQLLPILDGTEKYLSKVEQSPAASIVTALSSLTKALASEKLLKHSDADVRVGVASCISEITRITAPEAPYDDDKMKDVLQLIVSSFENISDTSSISYLKRVSILETVAKVRSCVIMLDLECDQMIIEMFQHFFKDIRDYHTEVVFNSMETIMTLILEESEDISPDILGPILSTLKKNNEAVLPVAKKLAERVIQSSANKLKTCLPQALRALNASVKDYSEILASMCQNSTVDVNGELEAKECTEETATNDANEPETEETATNGANEPETEETATNVANEQETEETATNAAIGPETEETVTNAANEPEAEETVVDAKCSENLDSDNVSDANLVSEEPARIEAKVEQVAKENGRQTDSNNESAESPDAVDSKKQSEEGNTGENIPTSPSEVLPHVEAAMSTENIKASSMQLSPSEQHENEDVTQVQVGSQVQVKKSARTKRKGKSAKKQKRSGKKQPAKKADKKDDSVIDEDESKKDYDNASDLETKPLEQTEKMQVSDEDNNSDAKEQNDSGEKLCITKAEKNSTSTEGSKSKNDGGNASGSETNSLDQTEKLKVSEDENIPVAKMQKSTGKKPPAKKAKASTLVEEDESKNDDCNASDSEASEDENIPVAKTEKLKVSEDKNIPVAKMQKSTGKKPPAKKAKASTLVEEDESKNDDGNASDSEASEDENIPVAKTEKLKVSEDKNIPVAKMQKSTGKKPSAKKAKAGSTLVEEDESKNDDGNASDSEANSLDKTSNPKVVSDEEILPVAKKQRSRKKQPAKKAKKAVVLIEENESENNGGGDSEIHDDSPLNKVGNKSGAKQTSDKDGSKSSAREDDGEDMVTSPRSPLRSTRDGANKEKSSRMSSKRKRTPGSENASGTIEYGENLVGSKIKVWWPHDREFYNGVIHSFDPVKKKHAVLYADGDQENLNLRREKWEFVGDDSVSDADEAVENSSDDDASRDMKRKKGASSEASSRPAKLAISDKSKKDTAKKSGVKSKDDDKSKDSAKATGKSKDVAKTPTSSKQESQKTAKSKAKTPQSAIGSSKAKESDKGTVKGKSQDTPKSRTSDAKSGKKRRR